MPEQSAQNGEVVAATPISRKSSSFDRNLKSLQRLDDAVNTIVCMAPHVVVYTMNQRELTWDREDIEGTLFLVSRTAEPWHSLIVVNRQNTNNMCQSLDDMFQYEVNGPYVMFRNGEGVRGFWFPQESDRTALIDSLTSTFAPPLATDKGTPNPKAPAVSATSPRKQQQTTSTQNNYNSNKNNSNNVVSTPVRQTSSSSITSNNTNAKLLTPDLLAQRRPQPLPEAIPSLNIDDVDVDKTDLGKAAAAPMINKTQSKTTGQTADDLVLGKKDFQDVLIKLIKNDQFISLLHNEYLQTTSGGRTRANSTVSNNTTQSAPPAQPAAQQQQQQPPAAAQYQQQQQLQLQQQVQLQQAQARQNQQQHARTAGPVPQQHPLQQPPRPQHPGQQQPQLLHPQQQQHPQPQQQQHQQPRGPPRPHGMPGGQVPYGYPMPIPGQNPQHQQHHQQHQQPGQPPAAYGPPAGYWTPPPVPGSGGAQQHAHYQQQMRAAAAGGIPPAPRATAMPVVPAAQGSGQQQPRGPPQPQSRAGTYIPVAVPASQAHTQVQQAPPPVYAQAPTSRPPQ